MPSWVVALYSVRGRNKTKTNNELENMTTLVLWANSYTKKAQPPGLLTCNSGDSCYQVSCLSPTRHRIGRPRKRRLEQSEPQRLNQQIHLIDRATQLHDCCLQWSSYRDAEQYTLAKPALTLLPYVLTLFWTILHPYQPSNVVVIHLSSSTTYLWTPIYISLTIPGLSHYYCYTRVFRFACLMPVHTHSARVLYTNSQLWDPLWNRTRIIPWTRMLCYIR